MSKVTVNDLKDLLSKNLPSASHRQLSGLIAEIEGQQKMLNDRIQSIHKCFSKEMEMTVMPTDPEAIGMALHKNPELCVIGRLDINDCYWWTMLALCEKYPQLHPFLNKPLLKGEVDVARIRYKHHLRNLFTRHRADNKVQEHFKFIRQKFEKLGITFE